LPFYLYKLKFTAPVHFGADKPGIGVEKVAPTCHADTLFSAICQEALALFGEEYLLELVRSAEEGRFLLSDLFPYYQNINLCLPKPAILFEYIRKNKKVKANQKDRHAMEKKIKRLNHIPISRWEDYISFGKGEKNDFQCKLDFGEEVVFPRVSVSRTGDDSNPYFVGAFIFREQAGLYFIAKIDDEKIKNEMETIITSLQYSGIGGKRSSGYGKFELAEDSIELDPDNYATEDDRKLATMFYSKEGDYYMTLSVLSPQKGEINKDLLEGAFYTLIPRNGFVDSPHYSDRPLKRKSLVMFNAGSCFKKKLKGDIKDVSDHGGHPVYRYGKAMMMGVKI